MICELLSGHKLSVILHISSIQHWAGLLASLTQCWDSCSALHTPSISDDITWVDAAGATVIMHPSAGGQRTNIYFLYITLTFPLLAVKLPCSPAAPWASEGLAFITWLERSFQSDSSISAPPLMGQGSWCCLLTPGAEESQGQTQWLHNKSLLRVLVLS